jgi:hypothetical protein
MTRKLLGWLIATTALGRCPGPGRCHSNSLAPCLTFDIRLLRPDGLPPALLAATQALLGAPAIPDRRGLPFAPERIGVPRIESVVLAPTPAERPRQVAGAFVFRVAPGPERTRARGVDSSEAAMQPPPNPIQLRPRHHVGAFFRPGRPGACQRERGRGARGPGLPLPC